MGGVDWDKIGVDKMSCKEQKYNEKTQVVFFPCRKIARLLYCLKMKTVYHPPFMAVV